MWRRPYPHKQPCLIDKKERKKERKWEGGKGCVGTLPGIFLATAPKLAMWQVAGRILELTSGTHLADKMVGRVYKLRRSQQCGWITQCQIGAAGAGGTTTVVVASGEVSNDDRVEVAKTAEWRWIMVSLNSCCHLAQA